MRESENGSRAYQHFVFRSPPALAPTNPATSGHRFAARPNKKTCPQKWRSRLSGFPTDVVAVVQGVVFGPMRARFGRFKHGGKERIVLGREFKGFYFYIGAFRQLCSRRQDDHTILHFSGHDHGNFFRGLSFNATCSVASSFLEEAGRQGGGRIRAVRDQSMTRQWPRRVSPPKGKPEVSEPTRLALVPEALL